MEPNKKSEHVVFFAALAGIMIATAGGILYFNGYASENSSALVADIGSFAPTPELNAQDPSTTVAVETIPAAATVAATSSAPTSAPLKPLTLPYSLSDSTANENYWPKAWGDISFKGANLILIPDPSYHGADSFLNGADTWNDYAVSTKVSPLEGGWFDIVARDTNNTKNFVYCEFGSNGTEIIERVNTIDTQLAHTSASTTPDAGASETFGMKVYGNDISCEMNGDEVLGVEVPNGNESATGGIGFVIFGAPTKQKQVEVSEISVVKLSRDTITAPFPIVVAVLPPTPITPPVVVPPPAPVETEPSTTPPTPPPAPAPVPATTTKTLPYSADTFYKGDGWGEYWGTFLEASDSLTIGSSKTIPSGGALLGGTAPLSNYTFTANVDWVKGEQFGLFARHTNDQNYVECKFDQPANGVIQMSLVQDVRGNYVTLNQTDLDGYNNLDGSTLVTSIEVQDTNAICGFDGHFLSNSGTGHTINPPYSGEVGITTWDSGTNNSEVIVNSVDIKNNY